MQDATVVKLAIISFLVGAAIMIVVMQQLPPEGSPGNLSVGESRIRGTVTNVELGKSSTRIEVEGACSITVVAFERIRARKGQNADVVGSMEVRNGKQEMIAEEIVLW